jgi:hypothetical protein
MVLLQFKECGNDIGISLFEWLANPSPPPPKPVPASPAVLEFVW